MRKIVLLCSALIGVSSSLFAQNIIVIDNNDARFEGLWTSATSSREKWGENYRFATTTAESQPTSTATYTPTMKAAGRYHVEVYFPAGENRADNAAWLVQYDGGKETVAVNQKINSGTWVRILTDKPFAAGTGGYIQVRNNTGASGSVVIADAVRLVPVGANIPSPVMANSSSSSSSSSNPKPSLPSGPKTGFGISINISGAGKVTRDPEQAYYSSGTVVKLTPVPDSGYVFDGWDGEVKGYKNPLKLTMTADKSLTVRFAEAGTGVIIDNMDEAVEFQGKWTQSTTNWPGTRWQNYHISSAKGKAESTATFRPNIPRPGLYDIYVSHVAGRNRTTAAQWTVAFKGGQISTTVNQQVQSGEWVLIAAAKPMDAGSKPSQYVQLSNSTPDHDQPSVDGSRVVIADAVAFVYMGE